MLRGNFSDCGGWLSNPSKPLSRQAVWVIGPQYFFNSKFLVIVFYLFMLVLAGCSAFPTLSAFSIPGTPHTSSCLRTFASAVPAAG